MDGFMYRVTFTFRSAEAIGQETNGCYVGKLELVSALAMVIGLHTEPSQQHALHGRVVDISRDSLVHIHNALVRGEPVSVLIGLRCRLTALNSNGTFEAVKDQSFVHVGDFPPS